MRGVEKKRIVEKKCSSGRERERGKRGGLKMTERREIYSGNQM